MLSLLDRMSCTRGSHCLGGAAPGLDLLSMILDRDPTVERGRDDSCGLKAAQPGSLALTKALYNLDARPLPCRSSIMLISLRSLAARTLSCNHSPVGGGSI